MCRKGSPGEHAANSEITKAHSELPVQCIVSRCTVLDFAAPRRCLVSAPESLNPRKDPVSPSASTETFEPQRDELLENPLELQSLSPKPINQNCKAAHPISETATEVVVDAACGDSVCPGKILACFRGFGVLVSGVQSLGD